MDPLPENILKILFQIRCRIYFAHQRDWDRFLGPLRNWVKTDERVRWSLVDFLVDFRDGNPCLGDFSSDESMCIDWLCRQLPDSSQLLYLLRRLAFDPHGEDGLPTAVALRLLESKFPEDPWFRRETEQYGGGRGTGFSNSHYLDYPSEAGWTRLQVWADEEPKYRAMVHPDRTYPGDSPTNRETFDLPPDLRGPIDGDWSSDSSVERLRWLLNWHVQWCPESKMLERLVGQAKAQDVPALLELAELRRDVLLEIPKISHRHPSVGEYCRRRLETAQDRWFAGLLAAKASDTALALWALDWFLEHRHDPTSSGE